MKWIKIKETFVCPNCGTVSNEQAARCPGCAGKMDAPNEIHCVTANEYQALAMRTNDGKMTERLSRPDLKEGWDLGGIMEGCLGISGESGELVDLIKKWVFHEKPLDEIHVKKELGDVLWYAALLCESFGWKMSEIMELNIEKLKARYPDGFNPTQANNRKEGDI